ncbi:hypothetical protein D3C75_1183440 [compost metagenome]
MVVDNQLSLAIDWLHATMLVIILVGTLEKITNGGFTRPIVSIKQIDLSERADGEVCVRAVAGYTAKNDVLDH